MKKKLFFNIMLVCITLFVYHGATFAGITGKIAGIITDASTGEPLPAVNVVIEGTTMGGATDAEGSYFIINIPPGTYSLQASMVGYTVESKTGIIVNVDHTTPINFDLRVTAIAGEEVTVTAEREIIPMDISASHIVADAEQIVEVPLITDITQYIHLQAGILSDEIRGGGLDQQQFMMDGLMVVDNLDNRPMMMVNLSAVKELNIIKGGFNAEYGNVRSGLINVVTREGSPSIYHGSFDFRISPPRIKHDGVKVTNPDCWYLRPYLDPDVMWVGTKNGTWDEYKQQQHAEFRGWNTVSAELLADDIEINDRTPQECQDIFLWQHALEGSEKFGQKVLTYADKPDWNTDISFGGPVPYVGGYLGNLSFFASYRTNYEMFALPTDKDYFIEENFNLKVTSRLSQSMKLTFEGLYGEVHALETSESSGTGIYGKAGGIPDNNLYLPWTDVPISVYRNMVGIAFDHVLSPRTFYGVRISYIRNQDVDPGFERIRDRTTIRYFGNTPVDETPYGAWWVPIEEGWGLFHPAHIKELEMDNSEINTVHFKFDMTSQIDKYNQIKGGLELNYDNIRYDLQHYAYGQEHHNFWNIWGHVPLRGGAFIQDKLEFEGMIANFGVRLDYNDPNCEWYTVDRYSEYFTVQYKKVFTEVCPTEPAKGHLKISPRLGVSHPISENAKLYFNYGHFYSMPSSMSMYRIGYGAFGRPIDFLGNPSADLPKTVSYELGVEYNVRDLFLIHLAGYYKDITDQTGDVAYTDFDGLVDYETTENNHYADIRGFELRIDKRFGRFITGWLNYNYMVETSGYVGREHYYEDPREQAIEGLQNPKQERPLARPIARANLNFRTPVNWGPTVAGIKPLGDIHLSALYSWRAGSYQDWDPLNTYELVDNLQWKSSYNVDARFSKRMRFGKYSVQVFADVNNLFNIKTFNTRGFLGDTDDRTNYLESLHLPMYEGEDYQTQGYTPGNDKPGDFGGPGTDKPYINMPNKDLLTFLNQRYVFFGLKIDF